MRHQRPPSPVLLAALLAVLLMGCNGAERQRREQAAREQAAAAQRQRQLDGLVNRCRQQQPAVQKLVQEHDRSVAALNQLSQLSQQRYAPLPQPTAPDPAVLARFTRDDQELEQERYVQALARWREADGAERRRWEAGQEARRQELTARQSEARQALAKLDVAATAAARTAWSSCDSQGLAAAALR
jgi:hypothetical protein